MDFKRLANISLGIVFLLVLAGGIVRSTGSGMGCPDWPKCFGRLIPPTRLEELPLNYQDIYKEKLHGEVVFNPVKTWIEYLNRLLGALTGLVVLITTILAVRTHPRAARYAGLAMFFVLANAVLGKFVVDSFLMPGVVTAHMILTIAVIYFLLKAIHYNHHPLNLKRIERRWVLINLILVGIQILSGTQVRESLDPIMKQWGESGRDLWIDQLSWSYYFHRSFTWVLMLAALALWKYGYHNSAEMANYKRNVAILLGISVLTGVLMAYFALPFATQPVHLTLSMLILGLHLKTWIRTTHA